MSDINLVRARLEPRAMHVLKSIKSLGGKVDVKLGLQALYDECYKTGDKLFPEKMEHVTDDQQFWNVILQVKALRLASISFGTLAITPDGEKMLDIGVTTN